jgi:undecaprenyl-diphosphatase
VSLAAIAAATGFRARCRGVIGHRRCAPAAGAHRERASAPTTACTAERPSTAVPTLAQATWLGLLHGPAELLPISSSAHVELAAHLLGSGYSELDAELRKSFDVALHAGAAGAMLLAFRGQLADALARRQLAVTALASVPPALAGATLERVVERRLGGPRQMAVGLIVGALAMLISDRRPQRRTATDAGIADALTIGCAQALALIPGVSRAAATLSAARLRTFTCADAARLSRQVGLPVIAGAAALKGARLARGQLPRQATVPLAAGALSSFASALACSRLTFMLERGPWLRVLAAYRLALGGLVLARGPLRTTAPGDGLRTTAPGNPARAAQPSAPSSTIGA